MSKIKWETTRKPVLHGGHLNTAFQETKIKLSAQDTIVMVRNYLLSQKFAGEDSADATSRRVGCLIKKYGITVPDQTGLRKLADEMEINKLKNSTKRTYLYALETWADAIGRPINIKQTLKRLPPLEYTHIEIVSDNIILKIPEATGNSRDTAILYIAAYCGIREKEATRLLREDVDLDKHIVHIKNRGRKTLKNRRDRDTPIPDELIPYLEDWILAREKYLIVKGIQLAPDDDYFFITIHCTGMDPDTIVAMTKNVNVKLGLPPGHRFTYHKLRHTSNSNALSHGISPADCVENYGWSDLKIIERYTHCHIESRVENMKNFSYKKRRN